MYTHQCPPPSEKFTTLYVEITTVDMKVLTRRGLRKPVEIPITDELDRFLCERLADAGIAQGAQLGFALHGVAGGVIRIEVARVTAQLGDPSPDLRPQHPLETLDAELLEVCLSTPLPVELREVANPGMFAE